jgi:MinD-like ATPase involved in chromosome partitioning or flagellar assembly
MNHRHIAVVGARGGHGATTVAAVLALYAARRGPTTLVSHDIAEAGVLLGIAGSRGTAQVTAGLVLASDARDAACVVEDCGHGELERAR